MELEDDDLEGKPKKLTRARKIRMAIVFTLAIMAAAVLVYTRYIVKKSGLGEPCKYAFHCGKDAPKCMRGSEDGDGICSRPCDPAADCAPGIRCMKIELDERDDRGMPLYGGFCFPQSFLDAQNPKAAGKRDAGPPPDSWLDVPRVPNQLEAEVSLHVDQNGVEGPSRAFFVKGSLVESFYAQGSRPREIVDTAGLRAFTVDDAKKTFAARVLAPLPGEAKIDKTGKHDVVVGHDCEIWKIDDGKSKLEACIVQGAAFVDPQARTVTVLERELAVRGAFPLRVTEIGANGQATPRLTVTRFEVHGVDGALFVIPKTFKNLAQK